MTGETTGLIFDVKRFAVHDGPGIRSTVFLKGCTLQCAWCHNPESIDRRPQLLVHASRCIACGSCVAACPTGAHSLSSDGVHEFDRSRCTTEALCTEVCYAGALEIAGKVSTVDEIVELVERDRVFYETSGGGVTLSGGEPLAQRDFAASLLRRCREAGLHTAVDTSGHVPWAAFEAVLPYTDLFLYDMKVADRDEHRRWTSAPNDTILENLERLGATDVAIEIRVPVVPGVNDSPESASAIGTLLAGLTGVRAVRLLPYHRLAGSKYESVGRPNTMPRVETPSEDHLVTVAEAMSAASGREELAFLVGDRTVRGSRVVQGGREDVARA